MSFETFEGSSFGTRTLQSSSTCGTIAGYHAHHAGGEDACIDCRRAYGLVQSLLDEGLTYRRLDYWVRKGYLQPDHPEWARQGTPREWPEREIEIARLIYRLTSVGLDVEVSAGIARSAVDEVMAGAVAHVELARGLWIGITRATTGQPVT